MFGATSLSHVEVSDGCNLARRWGGHPENHDSASAAAVEFLLE